MLSVSPVTGRSPVGWGGVILPRLTGVYPRGIKLSKLSPSGVLIYYPLMQPHV